MTNYRSSLESKLADIEAKLVDLNEEKERLLSALGVLDEIDSGLIRDKTSSKHPGAKGGTLIDIVFSILRERSMTANDIYKRIGLKREASKASMHTALSRLRKRGKVSKEGDLWGVVGSNDSTEQQQQP